MTTTLNLLLILLATSTMPSCISFGPSGCEGKQCGVEARKCLKNGDTACANIIYSEKSYCTKEPKECIDHAILSSNYNLKFSDKSNPKLSDKVFADVLLYYTCTNPAGHEVCLKEAGSRVTSDKKGSLLIYSYLCKDFGLSDSKDATITRSCEEFKKNLSVDFNELTSTEAKRLCPDGGYWEKIDSAYVAGCNKQQVYRPKLAKDLYEAQKRKDTDRYGFLLYDSLENLDRNYACDAIFNYQSKLNQELDCVSWDNNLVQDWFKFIISATGTTNCPTGLKNNGFNRCISMYLDKGTFNLASLAVIDVTKIGDASKGGANYSLLDVYGLKKCRKLVGALISNIKSDNIYPRTRLFVSNSFKSPGEKDLGVFYDTVEKCKK